MTTLQKTITEALRLSTYNGQLTPATAEALTTAVMPLLIDTRYQEFMRLVSVMMDKQEAHDKFKSLERRKERKAAEQKVITWLGKEMKVTGLVQNKMF